MFDLTQQQLNTISIIGTFVSIISALASFIIFLFNKKIRNEIIVKRNIEIYSIFIVESTKSVDSIKKYTGINGKTKTLSADKLNISLLNYYELVKKLEVKLVKDGYITIISDLVYLKNKQMLFSCNGNNIYKNNITELQETYYKILDIQNRIKNILDRNTLK